ncbi:pantoate--beta-alanine ligase [Texcoconibacillus texcoconensis]|uniref:Pantothenate synthetase n=1 Tax=Texcoconibacillus texcoconensis TaxID=1095777 RepID=A0A840QQE0_9BACI|nr:pantoate--beta-alanine ligase [Texcoconibacillus texcoconensis]MBB5173580.1 pantoate--beta-alanine ligase [Texcoconibacillus texcoconensis]
MKTIQTIKELKEAIHTWKREGKTIGFVPTMGAFHEGHIALVKAARQEADIVVCSLFVNPLQFAPGEDYDRYPRTLDADKHIASREGVDLLFCPTVSEMYPEPMTVNIHVKRRVDCLCGKDRPGHFDGVATVVLKLLQLTECDFVYFGLKDAQQVAVIEGLVNDFHLPQTVRRVETVREQNGLAMSSRNRYLSEKERDEAAGILRSLQRVKKWVEEGEVNRDRLIDVVHRDLSESLSGTVDYVDIRSFPELQTKETLQGETIVAAAVSYPSARLIDNIIVHVPNENEKNRGECHVS